MTIYTQTDDTGFNFRAAVPVAQAPKDARRATSQSARHRPARRSNSSIAASYDALDTSYEAITDFLDDKGLDAKDVFIEEYASGPLRADDNDL